MVGAALGKDQALRAQALGQPVPRTYGAMRVQLRRSAAHDTGVAGIGSDHGDCHCVGRQRQQRAVVLQQDGSIGPGAADQGTMGRAVILALGLADRSVQRPAALHQAQNPTGRRADACRIHPPVLHRSHQRCTTVAGRSGHFKVKSGVDGRFHAARPEPVGHHDTIPLPFVAQNFGQKPAAFGGIDTIHLVVRRHHRPGPADQPAATARAVRAVGHDKGPYSQPLDARDRSEIGARQERDLLVQRHRIQQRVNLAICHGPVPSCRASSVGLTGCGPGCPQGPPAHRTGAVERR